MSAMFPVCVHFAVSVFWFAALLWLLHIQDLFDSILRLEGGNTLIFNTNMSFAITKLQLHLIQGLKL